MERETEIVGAGDTEEIEKEKAREKKERKKDKHKEIIKRKEEEKNNDPGPSIHPLSVCLSVRQYKDI